MPALSDLKKEQQPSKSLLKYFLDFLKKNKLKLRHHFLHFLLAASIGILTALLLVPVATFGVAALIGLGFGAVSMVISQVCSCVCTSDSAKTRSDKRKKNKGPDLIISVTASNSDSKAIYSQLMKDGPNRTAIAEFKVFVDDISKNSKKTRYTPTLATHFEDPPEEPTNAAQAKTQSARRKSF